MALPGVISPYYLGPHDNFETVLTFQTFRIPNFQIQDAKVQKIKLVVSSHWMTYAAGISKSWRGMKKRSRKRNNILINKKQVVVGDKGCRIFQKTRVFQKALWETKMGFHKP